MDPFLSSRQMYLYQLPPTINIADELDAAMMEFTTKGLQENPSVEAGAVVCHDGAKFYFEHKTYGSRASIRVDHKGVPGVGGYHSHPGNGPLNAADVIKMLDRDRRYENFSLLDGAQGRRSALFKTVDSPPFIVPVIQNSLVEVGLRPSTTSNPTNEMKQQIVEIARCAFMGYYEGFRHILYRVYPSDKKVAELKKAFTSHHHH